MMADGRTGQLELRSQLAHAHLGLAGDEGGEAEADGVAEGFEHGCDACGVSLVDDAGGQAATDVGLDGGQLLHSPILTYVETAGKDAVSMIVDSRWCVVTGQTEMREAVRQRYAAAALTVLESGSASCCGRSGCGCGSSDPVTAGLYQPGEAPSEGALAASLGCGNPTALIDLAPGQVVLDLGSGGGLDVLLSARRVAPDGVAYGLDMTEEMLAFAERNRAEAGIENARFVKGAIEDVPLPDASVDVVISNCVINLSTDKDKVLAEAFRVLRPGGRFAVSDIVLLRPLPAELVSLVGLWTGCISGALLDTDYLAKLSAAGFANPAIQVTRTYTREDLAEMAGQLDAESLPDGVTPGGAIAVLEGAFASAFIRADKEQWR